jgi:hypothetical protein
MHHGDFGLGGTLGYANKIEESDMGGKKFVGIEVTQMEMSMLNGPRNLILFA